MQVRNSIDVDDARRSYFENLFPLNPGGIIPVGPTLADLGLDSEHGRGSQDLDKVFHLRSELKAAEPVAVSA